MKPRVVVLGAGRQARVVLDVLSEVEEFEIVGCTGEAAGLQDVLGCRIVGDDSQLPRLLTMGVRHAFVAIGDNRRRLDLLEHVARLGFLPINVLSRHAILSPRIELGKGVAVLPGAVINVGARIGDGVIINTGAVVEHDCEIGKGAHIASGVSMAGCVRVGEGALVGTGSSVIPDVEIGPWSVVGAGSAVTRSVPQGVLAAGVPALVKKTRQHL